jgi:hypothetical protein
MDLALKPLDGLSQDERKAYEKHVSENKPPISPKTAAEFFELYLAGSSCSEIVRLNPGFGLGLVVRARIDHDWDARKAAYLDTLYQRTQEKYQRAQLEAIDFVADSMSVYRKLWGDRFKKFLQTNNPEDLHEYKDMSIKQYQVFTEMLLKMTGQDNPKQPMQIAEVIKVVETPAAPTDKKITSQDAADILKTIDVDFKRDK